MAWTGPQGLKPKNYSPSGQGQSLNCVGSDRPQCDGDEIAL